MLLPQFKIRLIAVLYTARRGGWMRLIASSWNDAHPRFWLCVQCVRKGVSKHMATWEESVYLMERRVTINHLQRPLCPYCSRQHGVLGIRFDPMGYARRLCA